VYSHTIVFPNSVAEVEPEDHICRIAGGAVLYNRKADDFHVLDD